METRLLKPASAETARNEDDAPSPVRAFTREVMGTVASLHIRSASEGSADEQGWPQAAQEAFALLERADRVFSVWNPQSELMRIRHGLLSTDDADPWFSEVQALSVEAEVATEGFFTTDLQAPGGSWGWDPTGLVKGWALDRAADHLRAVPGIEFCLNGGGDIVCGVGAGVSGPGAGWRIGIADPADNSQVHDVVYLASGALATSGTGERGAHIIDPRTGEAADSLLSSVTVTGPELVWADVWATAAFIDAQVMFKAPAEYRLASMIPA